MSNESYRYSLTAEADAIVSFVAQTVQRFRIFGQAKTVNVVELGYCLSVARLGVWLSVTAPGNDDVGPWEPGYHEYEDRAVFCQFYTMPSWPLLANLLGNIQITDHRGHRLYDSTQATLVAALGDSIAEIVAKRHAEILPGLDHTNPLKVLVFEDDDADFVRTIHITDGQAEVYYGDESLPGEEEEEE